LALEMLDSKGPLLPHAWIAGDAEMGRPAWFRRELTELGERYLLAVPSNSTIRDLDAEPPPYSGRGRRREIPFVQVRDWCDALPDDIWTTLRVRDGAKGPIEVQIVRCRVRAKIDKKVGPEEMLVVIRNFDEAGKVEIDYYLSNGPPETPPAELARVANAEHRIEECIKRGKSEAGMAQYQARNWLGWHHHIALCMIAVWFLLLETRREKKMDADDDGAAGPQVFRKDFTRRVGMRHASADTSRVRVVAEPQPACGVGTSGIV
jgi:SRSO17 transposase